jgi:hypothetical protein
MSVATPTVTRIQDQHDYDQFQAFPAGVLLMTPDVVPVDVTVPAAHTAIWNNMSVPPDVTVEAAGLLVDPAWS